MGTLRFFEEVVSFKIRRTFGFADYIRSNAMDDLVFEQSPALPLQNNIRSGKAGEKKSVT